MRKAFAIDQISEAARLLLLDVAIGQGARSAVVIDEVDEVAEAELSRRQYVEAYLASPRAEWHGGYSGARSARITAQGRAWLQGVLEGGRWRLSGPAERGRWDKVLAALRAGGEVWTEPVAEVLVAGGEWGQGALAGSASDEVIVPAVAALYGPGSTSAALERIVAAAPGAGPDRASWLDRADEVSRAWGRPLFGTGGWLAEHTAASCPVVETGHRTWRPVQLHAAEERRVPVRMP